MTTLRALLAAGGTGGHLFPAQALAGELTRMGWDVHLATDRRGAVVAIPSDHCTYHRLFAGGIAGKGQLSRLKNLFLLAIGFAQSLFLALRLRPAIAVGFGGYPSLAPLLAAKLLGAKLMIHEQNAKAGRANRFLLPYASKVAAGFPGTSGLGNQMTVTGNPVRPDIGALFVHPYLAPQDRIYLLITGGSQGARAFSTLIPQAVSLLPEEMRQRLFIAQQVRVEDLPRVKEYYQGLAINAELAPFFNDMPDRLRKAHLVIARAGASTLAELAMAGKPSILIPLPNSIDGHQDANADIFAKIKAAQVFKEKDLTPKALADALVGQLTSPQTLSAAASAARALARPNAAADLAGLAKALIGSKGGNHARAAA